MGHPPARPASGVADIPCRRDVRWAGVLLVAGVAAIPALAQSTEAGRSFLADDPSGNFGIQNLGATPYRPLPSNASHRAPYNVRMGPVSARFSTSLAFAYTDNAVLSDQALGRADDFSITPMFNTALEWPITDLNGLRIDVGIGYQKHLIQSQLDSLTVSPNSTIDWMVIAGNCRISFYNRTSTPADVIQRPELVATGSAESAAFRQIQNQAGLSASWLLSKDVSLQGGYTYGIERGLAGGYESLNRDSHTATAALYRRLNPIWTVGLSGSGAIQTFPTGFQNNSQSTSGGVLGSWQPSRYLNVSANVRYTVTTFDRSGRVTDTSEFSGITYDVQVSHRFHRDWMYLLGAGKNANTGFGNNFTEQIFANIGLSWTGIDNLGVHADASYVNAKESGTVITYPRSQFQIGPSDFRPGVPGMVDEGFGNLFYFPPGVVDRGNGVVDIPLPGQGTDMVQFGLSVSRHFGRKLTGAISYGYALRVSDLRLRSYSQNTVTLNLSYQF